MGWQRNFESLRTTACVRSPVKQVDLEKAKENGSGKGKDKVSGAEVLASIPKKRKRELFELTSETSHNRIELQGPINVERKKNDKPAPGADDNSKEKLPVFTKKEIATVAQRMEILEAMKKNGWSPETNGDRTGPQVPKP